MMDREYKFVRKSYGQNFESSQIYTYLNVFKLKLRLIFQNESKFPETQAAWVEISEKVEILRMNEKIKISQM